MVRKVLGWLLIYALTIYMIVAFWPWYDYYPIRIDPPQAIEYIPFFLVLWWVLWIVYDVIRYVLKVLTIPLNFMSFGVVHWIINVGVLYIIPHFVAQTEMGVTVTMWNFLEVAILAILLSILGLLIKYL